MTVGSTSASNEGRRRFLRWATALSAIGTAALAGLPSLLGFLSPTRKRVPRERWVKLGEAAQFDIGTPIRIDFTETVNDAWMENRLQRTVMVYTADGENFVVYNARCTHLGCIVFFDGDKGLLHSPCHHGLFDVKTGEVKGGPPPRPLDALQVKIDDEGFLYCLYQDFRVGIPDKIPV